MEQELIPILPSLLLILWLITRHVARPKPTTKITKPPLPPSPPGALPLVGHLHLLVRANTTPACKILASLADQYGAVYSLRFGSHNLVVLSGSEPIKDCLTTNDRTLATRASLAVGKHLGYNNAILSLAPYGPYWRHVRKMATVQLLSNHRITKHRIESMSHVRLSEVNAFVNEVYGQSRAGDGVVEIGELLERLAFNISLRMVVGKRFGEAEYTAERSDVRRYKAAVEEAVRLSGVFVASDALSWLEWVDLGGYVRDMKKAAKVIDEVVGKWLDERNGGDGGGDGGGGDRDFMDVMMSSLGGDLELDVDYSRDTIIKATTLVSSIKLQILTLTGSGSTSLTVTWALSLLLNHPTILVTAQAELDRHVGRKRWVQESDIPNLTYLQAIIKETLRLYPPGPLTGIREATEDCHISGYHVPKGTRVVINIWKLHRDPTVWDSPDEFKPERFMTRHADVDSEFVYLPFSYGRRSCPAVNLGMRVVQLVLGRVIQGFDLVTRGGVGVDMAEGEGIALTKVVPLEVVATPRLDEELYLNL
ncbi:Dimethylnonatriene synthase [Linum perenne]